MKAESHRNEITLDDLYFNIAATPIISTALTNLSASFSYYQRLYVAILLELSHGVPATKLGAGSADADISGKIEDVHVLPHW